ncbi:MAG TPA: hypothetical protein VMG38_02230 [Trebonia sp.]|nr:hypothetical protein [Trebonia sp.]
MAIDWGRQPWNGERRADPGQWGQPGQWVDQGQQPPVSQDHPGRRRPRLAIAALVLGAVAMIFSGYQVYSAIMPRKFTPGQQRQIMAWEVASRWRQLPAGAIFPATVTYPPPQQLDDGGTLTMTTRRLGIAPQATCQEGTDPAAAAVLGPGGCEAVLRATYVDGTGSFLVTIGVVAFPSAAQATAAEQRLSPSGTTRAGALAPGVQAVPFPGTQASGFTSARRQLSGSLGAGPYIVLYTIGYADGRPKVAVSGDEYTLAEMTSMGQGLAGKIAGRLAASPPAPHCPGVPGC